MSEAKVFRIDPEHPIREEEIGDPAAAVRAQIADTFGFRRLAAEADLSDIGDNLEHKNSFYIAAALIGIREGADQSAEDLDAFFRRHRRAFPVSHETFAKVNVLRNMRFIKKFRE